MTYKLLYSDTSKQQIRRLHPHLKPHVKTKLEQLIENPYLGKHLERELSGYMSFRTLTLVSFIKSEKMTKLSKSTTSATAKISMSFSVKRSVPSEADRLNDKF